MDPKSIEVMTLTFCGHVMLLVTSLTIPFPV